VARGHLARVRALDDGHPRVVAKPPVELPVRDVERHDVRGAPLQEAVREPASRCAHVEAAPPGGIDPERVQRVRQLDPAARYERRRLLHAEGDVAWDELSRLRRALPALADPNRPGEHGRRRARAGLEQPPLDEQ